MAQTYGTTPAALLAIEDAYVAYCLNEACLVAAMTARSDAGRVQARADNAPALAALRRLGAPVNRSAHPNARGEG